MADSTSNLDTISSTQAQKEVTANAALNSASPSMFGANRATTTSSLTWGYYGGRWRGTTVANGTVTLTGSSTNYIVADRSTGAVSVSTATTNWNNQSRYLRLYSVVTSSSSASSWQDHRQVYDQNPVMMINYQAITSSPPVYTVLATDLGATIELDHASGVTVTLPNNLPVGFHCRIMQAGAGQVDLNADTGAQLRNRQSHDKTAGQYAVVDLYVSKNGTGTSAEWVLSGDTTT